MESDRDYDIAVIGGGPGGYVAALKAARSGADVAMIEKENVGGTCLNWGCIPTKALIHSAGLYRDISSARRHGIDVGDFSLDYSRMSRRKDGVVKRLVRGIEHLLDKAGVDLIEARGELLSSDLIELEGAAEDIQAIGADNVIIATGSKPLELPIPGGDLDGVLDSRDLLSLTELPESMVIIGAGIIGMEFASLMGNLGCEITILEMEDQILPGLDEDVAEELTNIAGRRGIEIKTESTVRKIERGEEGLEVHFEHGDEAESSPAEKVLLAVGRKPSLCGIDPEKLGIDHDADRGGIEVDERMQTSLDGVYAVGDVTDRMLLAHVAFHQALVAVKNIMGEECRMDYSAVPSVIFTDPEVAVVGLSEEEAEEKNFDYNTARFPFSANGKVLAAGERRGFIKIISEQDSNRILGCAIVGIHASDMIASPALALNNGLTALDIADTIHAHPTTAEVIHEAALMAAEGEALHS